MVWNWQRNDWPIFTWHASRLADREKQFLLGGGILLGAAQHLGKEQQDNLRVEIMSSEALTTSEVEGEILDRVSLQSSIRRRLGLAADNRRVEAREQGIAEMMVDVLQTFGTPLTEETLCSWQAMVTNGRRDLADIGQYRTHAEPMQIVSPRADKHIVYFEAPSSAQGVGQPVILALSATVLARRKEYYAALASAQSGTNDLSDWLTWFTQVGLEAQHCTLALVEFLIGKAQEMDRLRGHLNPRQEKALLRMFEAGPDGFAGGMTAKKYISITSASIATATRDLTDLTEKGALVAEGTFRDRHYHLRNARWLAPHVTVSKRSKPVEAKESL